MLALLAVAAGFLSFASPCCLPLMPAYLSFVSSVPVADLTARQARRRLLTSAAGFVAGFSLVFAALGASASMFGYLLIRNQRNVGRGLGVIVIIFGVVTLLSIGLPGLSRELRLLHRVPRGPAWAVPLGMAFAAGWTPCLGPTLASILTLASTSRDLGTGVALLLLYSLGLGVPFLALAVGFGQARGAVGWLKRHGRVIERAGGVLMVALGIGLVTGAWEELFRPLQRSLLGTRWPPI